MTPEASRRHEPVHEEKSSLPVYALLLIGILAVPIAFAGDGPPTLLRFRHNPAVASWVDESVAFDADGRLREDLWFSTAVRQNIEMNATGKCTYFIHEPPLETFDDSTTLTNIAMNARAVLSGRVVSVSRGFFHGLPGTLVGFRVTEAIARHGDAHVVPVKAGSIRYTFVGKAEIMTPHGAICSATGVLLTLPQPGDTILFPSYVSPPDEAEIIFPIDSQRHLIVERSGKRIFTPSALTDDVAGVTIEEVMRRVREVADRAQRQR